MRKYKCETCGKEMPTGIITISAHWSECEGKGFYEALLKKAEEKKGRLTKEDIDEIKQNNQITMTLKEKIETAFWKNYGPRVFEEIANRFATEFAEWVVEQNIEFKDNTEDGNIYSWNKSGNSYDMYKLLQNSKIEKEL